MAEPGETQTGLEDISSSGEVEMQSDDVTGELGRKMTEGWLAEPSLTVSVQPIHKRPVVFIAQKIK